MEAQGREQADDPRRHALGGLGQAVVLGQLRVGQDVEASPRALEQARTGEAREVLAGDAVSCEVTRAQHARLAGEL